MTRHEVIEEGVEITPAIVQRVDKIIHGANKATSFEPKHVHYSEEAKAAGWKDGPSHSLPSISDPDPIREAEQDAKIDAQNRPPRKRRSDAGVPKAKKAAPAPAAGVLTIYQARELDVRVSSMIRTREALAKAAHEHDAAQKYYEDYLASLQGDRP